MMMRKEHAQNTKMYGIERERKKSQTQRTPSQDTDAKSWLDEDAKTAVENAHFVLAVVGKNRKPPSFEVGDTVPEEFFVVFC